MAARYFAYGSNMDARILREWCPAARVVGIARLASYRLDFRRRSIRWQAGVADLVATPDEDVWGVVYELPERALVALDEKEGVGIGAYERVTVSVELSSAYVTEAVTYAVVEKTPEPVAPSPAYAEMLLRAAADAGLPVAYRDRLAAHISFRRA